MLVEDAPKKQIRAEVIEKATEIFTKHLKAASNNRTSTEKASSLAKLAKDPKPSKKSPEKKEEAAAKKRDQLTIRKKTGS